MATSGNAQLLALGGERNPYPGRLGVVEPGALADLLLVNGNPLDDLSLIVSPQTSFAVIMKDAIIWHNQLA
jgi:imidazolonepropionase-like amidohydrolase